MSYVAHSYLDTLPAVNTHRKDIHENKYLPHKSQQNRILYCVTYFHFCEYIVEKFYCFN